MVGGAQRPVWGGNELKKTGARSARARTRGQNSLVYLYCTLYKYVGYTRTLTKFSRISRSHIFFYLWFSLRNFPHFSTYLPLTAFYLIPLLLSLFYPSSTKEFPPSITLSYSSKINGYLYPQRVSRLFNGSNHINRW
jgi:hypothetical protein